MYLIVHAMIALDFVTGLIKSFKEKNYTSSIMREGLYHKCGSIICVWFGVLVDKANGLMDLGINVPISVAICTYITLMEVGSVIENIGKINPHIMPSKIAQYFDKLKGFTGK